MITKALQVVGVYFVAALLAGVQAQQYPAKAIRWIVPYATGGAGDITARAVAKVMGESMSQSILIENRPGAGAIVGVDFVAKSPADGYTLVLWTNTQAISAAMFKKLPYDTVNDFAMVSTMGAFTFGVLVATESPIKTIKEMIAQAKASPGKFNVAVTSIGTTQHLAAELLKLTGGLDFVTVPFNSTGGVISAVRGGSVQLAVESLTPIMAQIQSGALRALAVSSASRYELLPDVPTLAESGLPGFDVKSWNGVAVPAKTPKAVIDRLNREIHAAVNTPQVKELFKKTGTEITLSTPEAMQKLLVDEIAKWNLVIEKANIPRQ